MTSKGQDAVVQFTCPECLKAFRYKGQENGHVPKCHYCGTPLERIYVSR